MNNRTKIVVTALFSAMMTVALSETLEASGISPKIREKVSQVIG